MYNKGRKKKSEIINEFLNFSHVFFLCRQKGQKLAKITEISREKQQNNLVTGDHTAFMELNHFNWNFSLWIKYFKGSFSLK